jgi:hypothetical protein
MEQGNCSDCGVFRRWLHGHHLKPRIEGGQDADGKIRICANCHEDRHGGPFGGILRGRTSATPAARRKKSKTLRKLWQDPEYRRKTLAGQEKARPNRDNQAIGAKIAATWTPERRAAQSKLITEIKANVLGDRWSLHHDCCKECKRTDRPHQANGLCSTCYTSRYYKNKRKRSRRRKYLREYMRKRRADEKAVSISPTEVS